MTKMHALRISIFCVLLLLASKQAGAACNLCFDGEAITKPDYVLDLIDPFSIKTCQNLVDLLLFIPEDDDLCATARAVSTVCGCPNLPLNACTICGRNMTKPLQNLDSLVDLGEDTSFFGLTPTCALVESSINIFNEDDEDCSSLPMDELKTYCGCLSNEDEGEDDNTCTLCPGGEIFVPGDDFDYQHVVINSQETTIYCPEALELVKGEENGSVLCTDIQRGATNCGCPAHENACELCPAVVRFNVVESSIFGFRQTCESFVHQLKSYDRNSVVCQSIDDSSREACGCHDVEKEFVPCTLCPGGEPVAYPDRLIVGMEGMGFDYLEPTCGFMEKTAALTPEGETMCTSARILAKLCGCHVPETACSICEAGNPPSHPTKEYQWAFGTITNSFPQFYETIDFNERKFRCEMADTFLSAAYDNEDDFCYFNQLIRGTACGCGGSITTKVVALVWTQRCSGILSLIGSLAIVGFVLTKKAKNRWNTYNQIVLSISIFDALSSMAYIFGTSLTPAALGLYGSIGSEGTCTFQGWLFQMGITSVYYNVVLCVYFVLVVKYDWAERKFKKVRAWVHLGILVVGIVMSIAIIPFVTADWRWCYLNKPPYSESWLPGLFFFILPIGICMLGMTVLMAFFVHYVYKVESKSERSKLSGYGVNRRSLTSQTFWQSLYFLCAFYTVWPIQFVSFIIPMVEENYWVFLLAAVVGPLQGFLNATVIFYRDRKTIRERSLQLFGIDYIRNICASSIQMMTAWTRTDSRKRTSGSNTCLSSPQHPVQVAESKQPGSPYEVESNEPQQDVLVTHADRDSKLKTSVRQIDELGAATYVQQNPELLPSSSNRDINETVGADTVLENSEESQNCFGAERMVNESRQASVQGRSVGENDYAIFEFAVNAGLLDDDDCLLE